MLSWFELSKRGKRRRLRKVEKIIDTDFSWHWEQYYKYIDNKEYDDARKLMLDFNSKGGRTGRAYNYSTEINNLLQ